jgi:DNA polymerase elongation subunit (family B)
MRTLIIDIETVGEDWDVIDPVTQTILKKPIDRRADTPEEWIQQVDDMQNDLGLSPLTGSIIVLGLYDLERAQGALYYVPKTALQYADGGEIDGFVCKARSEAMLLHEFWEGAKEYDAFVTFSGRSFDIPFLLLRSMTHGIRPTRELMKYRYLAQQSVPFHIDLMDELTFYGAQRRQSLHLFCRAFGIESSKDDGMTGADVGDAYRAGKLPDIIRYNISDVRATAQLYEKWREYVAPVSFLETSDL